MVQKRIAAIHDISGLGKCSLTVALPILSAAGHEACAIPTAVLSTHTGGFKDFTFRDLTDDIMPTVNHWKSNNFQFDAIYTGYLGSARQIDLMKQTIELLKTDKTLVVVDPVMADHGKLYGAFPPEFPSLMKELCRKADIITPNITEACFMLGRPYIEGPYTTEQIEDLFNGLKTICSGQIVLTGVYFDQKRVGAACLNPDTGHISYAFSDRVEGLYHGTGDIFTSTFLSAILNGKPTSAAIGIAVDYTYRCIKNTRENYPDLWYGVNFESQLPYLMEQMK